METIDDFSTGNESTIIDAIQARLKQTAKVTRILGRTLQILALTAFFVGLIAAIRSSSSMENSPEMKGVFTGQILFYAFITALFFFTGRYGVRISSEALEAANHNPAKIPQVIRSLNRGYHVLFALITLASLLYLLGAINAAVRL